MPNANQSKPPPKGGTTVSSRKRRRWGLPLFLFLAALFGAAIWAFNYFSESRDERIIRVERAFRRAQVSVGLPLAGTPDFSKLPARLSAHGVKLGDPVFVRIFKRDFELELWMQRDGRFHKFQTYPICRWSGKLGPKISQGDKQAPEGFYTVDTKALNPNSRWHRSFNLGFPNAFDQSLGRTGSFIMVHGGCGSVGCYAVTNAAIDELWRIITAALSGGQKRFQVQVFPFRMSEANLKEYEDSPHAAFWSDLKAGYDQFEAGNIPPKVTVCGKRYQVQDPGRVLDGSVAIEKDCPREAAKKA